MRKSGLTFGPWFKDQRRLSGKTQDEVAAFTGLHKVTISKIENGQSITEETAALLADAVGAPREEAVLRSLNVVLPAMLPANEEERKIRRMIEGVPTERRPALLEAFEAMARAAAA